MTRSFRHNSKARERDARDDRLAARDERTRKSKMRLRETERLDRMEHLPTAGAEEDAK